MTNKEKTNGIPEETGKLVRLSDEDVGQVTGGFGASELEYQYQMDNKDPRRWFQGLEMENQQPVFPGDRH